MIGNIPLWSIGVAVALVLVVVAVVRYEREFVRTRLLEELNQNVHSMENALDSISVNMSQLKDELKRSYEMLARAYIGFATSIQNSIDYNLTMMNGGKDIEHRSGKNNRNDH